MKSIAKAEKRVIGFFVAKGLLIDPKAVPMPRVKLSPEEVLEVAEQIEPRVYEVLPAALIHFPRSFVRIESYPEEILKVVSAIRNGVGKHPDLWGIRYKDMKRWADLLLSER